MFSRFIAFLPLVALVAASQCNTGPINCCNQVQQASDVNPDLWEVCGLTVAEAAVQGLVGVDCTPITVVGTGSGCMAEQQPVCCTGNNWNGLINIGCSPVDINA